MHLRTFLAASVATISLTCAIAVPAAAQETTAGMSGQVTGDSGTPVAGAKVIVKHVPSGTTASATTDGSGTFNLRGLRVGGPYTVTIDGAGYAPQTIEGLSLVVGDTLGVPVQLTQREIVVSAQNSGSRQIVQGSQSSFRSAQIQDIVSARRDIRDIVRRDLLAGYNPNIGGVTIAGGNIRTQRFSVDGVQMQDSFGLNYGGLPSSRGIVSIEMIDQLTVKAAPFDISEGNFQGGAVNVVLKSGTNKLHVTGFGNFGGPSLTGKSFRDNRVFGGDPVMAGKPTIFDFTNWGGSISGPLIRDKLFFSASYEQLSEGAANTYGVNGGSAANIVTAISQAQVDDVLARYNAAGYDKHDMGNVPTALTEKDKKYAAKIDWNITEGQRFSVSYIHHENTLPSFANGAGTGSTSASTPYIQLQSNLYQLSEFTNAVSGQLNSQWSDKLSSEVRVAYKFYRRGQDAYFGADYANFNVCLDGTGANSSTNLLCSTGTGAVRMGPDTARQANLFHNRMLTINTNMQLKAGAHTFKLEYDHLHSSLFNLFVYGGSVGANTSNGNSGGAQGSYYFDSLSDFSNRIANELTLTTTTTGNKNDGAVDWAYNVNTVGLQDTWKPTARLTFTGGVRFDMYDADKSINANRNFEARLGYLYPFITNTATYNGRSKLQPRFGFNWNANRDFRLSGGVGLFSGGLSDVFISNNYSNSGVAVNSTGATIASVDFIRSANASGCTERLSGKDPGAAVCTAALTQVAGGTVPQAVLDYVKNNATVSATTTTNSLDPKFKLPAQWKANLSAQYSPHFAETGIGSGWHLRADVLFSRAQEAVRWIDLRAQPLVVNGVTQVAPDGRPRYGGTFTGYDLNGNLVTVNPGGSQDIQLTNTTKGRAWVWALGVNRDFGSDFNLSASYTHQNVKDVAGILTSSTVGSSYGVATSDPNSGGDYGRSAFEITHTIRATLNFKHKFFGDNETRFGLNWELRSGQPFSLTMNDYSTAAAAGCNNNGRSCVFGTANSSSHLFYVPDFSLTPSTTASTTQGVAGNLTQYGNVVFADAATLAAVQNLVNTTGLKKYQGKITPKNVFSGPWYNKVDLNLAQQVPFLHGSHFTALFSIENFLNLLNRNWGSYQDYGTSATLVRVTCQKPAAGSAQTCPAYVYSAYSAPTTQTYVKPSLYAIRAGVRFDF